MEIALREWLVSQTTISTIVSDRVHCGIAPQGKTYPKIIIQGISRDVQYVFGGASGWNESRVQIDIYAQTYIDAAAVRYALFSVLSGAHFEQNNIVFERALFISERDLTESNQSDGTRLYRKSLDFQIFYKE